MRVPASGCAGRSSARRRRGATSCAQHLEARRLARVGDVGLVGDAEQQDPRALDRPAAVVERVGDLLQHEVGHHRVHLGRRVDQLRGVAVLAQAPGEEVRHDGDAIAAEARPRGSAARTRTACVEAASITSHGLMPSLSHISAQLVGERDVHGPEGVLVQLGRLGHHRARDGHHRLDDRLVEQLRAPQALVRDAAHELRGGVHVPVAVARVHALGRVAEEEVLTDDGAGALEDRPDDLLGPRPGRSWTAGSRAGRAKSCSATDSAAETT